MQDFYPTPGTVSTCMFYTGLDPQTMEPVYVPKSAQEKFYQRTLLQYYKPENRRAVIEALIHAHREDLIGYGPDCLVAPDSEYIRTHPRKPAAPKTAAKAGGQRAHSARSKTPAHRSRRGSVVTRDGVLTNDTRSPRQKQR